jgi:hypothetical protein
MHISRIVYWLIVMLLTIAYTLGCLFFAVAFIGVDKFQYSIGIFLIPLATWPLLLIAIVLLTKLQDRLYRGVFIGLMVAHYLITVVLEWQPVLNGIADEQSALLSHLQWRSGSMILGAGWYLAGQLAIWLAYLWQTGHRFKLE